LPSPRQPRDDPRPPEALTVAGGGASVDRLYDLFQRISSIEKSMIYLEGHADDAKRRLDSISTDITEAKATFGTLKFLFIAICAATWGTLSAAGLMWAKHHFGW
jgi:geranylgeranyl pyrophosphate synthase